MVFRQEEREPRVKESEGKRGDVDISLKMFCLSENLVLGPLCWKHESRHPPDSWSPAMFETGEKAVRN